MSAKAEIKHALRNIMSEGEANACQVFKGYNASTLRTGWHYIRFGYSQAVYIGKSLSEALDYIDTVSSERLED